MPDIPYNLTSMRNSDTLVDMITEANTLTDGLLSLLTLFVLFVIVFLALKRYEAKNAFASASFFLVVFSILFRLLGWVSDTIMYGSFLIAGIAFVWMRMSD